VATASSCAVPTPDGWRLASELMAGDTVFADDGSPQRVTVAHHYIPSRCYRVTFDDGLSIEGDRHMSFVLTDRKWRLRESEMLNRKNRKYMRGMSRPLSRRSVHQLLEEGLLTSHNRTQYALETCGPVQYAERNLPVPPYVMALWAATLSETGNNWVAEESFHKIRASCRALGYTLTPRRLTNGRRMFLIGPSVRNTFLFMGLPQPVWIPGQYFRASADQRRELLRGMKEGGMITKAAGDGRQGIADRNYRHQRRVQELLESLGVKTRLIHNPTLNNYSLIFNINVEKPQLKRRFLKKIEQTTPIQCSHVLAERPILVGEGFLAVC